MARYNDDYDLRPRLPPRSATYGTAHDHTRPKDSPPMRARDDRYDVYDRRGTRDARHTNDLRYHDTRSSAPDPRRPAQPSRAPRPRRHVWPPQPIAEDWEDVGEEIVPSRGTIDQEPVIIDSDQHSVSSSEDQGRSRTDVLTPPTSDDEELRKIRRPPSKLNVNDVPELSKRTSSPYSYTRPARLSREFSANDGYLAPERAERYSASPQPSSPRRNSRRDSSNARVGDYFASGSSVGESAVDDTEPIRGSSYDSTRKTQSSSYDSIRKHQSSTSTSGTSVVDFAPRPVADIRSAKRPFLEVRRHTDNATTLPSPSQLRVDKLRRTSPLVASPIALDQAQATSSAELGVRGDAFAEGQSRSRESSYSSSSRSASPVDDRRQQSVSGTPPQRWSSDFSSAEHDLAISRVESVPNSRPVSPPPRAPIDSPRVSQEEFGWRPSITTAQARRTKQPHPLSALQNPTRQAPAGYRPSPRSASTLPYPEDDGMMSPAVLMPSEHDHLFFGGDQSRQSREERRHADPPSPTLSTTSNTSFRASRPQMPRAYSAAPASPTQSRFGTPKERPPSSSGASMDSSQVRTDRPWSKMPRCPRPNPVAGYRDWYQAIDASSLDFCPDCVHNIFDVSGFRNFFQKASPRSLDTKVRCAFGLQWIRLAWCFTLQRERNDLRLLEDVMYIEETAECCPGDRSALRKWYGLERAERQLVDGFRVCHADMRKIKVLMPRASDMFVRADRQEAVSPSGCSMRDDSSRFGSYIEALMRTHDSHNSTADLDALARLVKRKPTCQTDRTLYQSSWHFIPEIPSLTVCEACFDEVVQPEVLRGSSLARKFLPAPKPAPTGDTAGSSCQLYSPYMRKVFRRAVDDADIGYLRRRSLERRSAEATFNDNYRNFQERAAKLAAYNDGSRKMEEERRRLDRHIDDTLADWRNSW